MKHRIGLFDVDCQELNEAGNGLSLRSRAEPLAESLDTLYACAEQHEFPVVFTTCCSGRMPGPEDLDGVLYVPLDPDCREWEAQVEDHRFFYLQKNAYGDPKINGRLRAFDMFQDNKNAERLIRRLEVDQWLAFGNAFDGCVACAARGLLAAGQKVRLLPDVGVLSASGTEERLRNVINELCGLGAETGTLEGFLVSIENHLSGLPDRASRRPSVSAPNTR